MTTYREFQRRQARRAGQAPPPIPPAPVLATPVVADRPISEEAPAGIRARLRAIGVTEAYVAFRLDIHPRALAAYFDGDGSAIDTAQRERLIRDVGRLEGMPSSELPALARVRRIASLDTDPRQLVPSLRKVG